MRGAFLNKKKKKHVLVEGSLFDFETKHWSTKTEHWWRHFHNLITFANSKLIISYLFQLQGAEFFLVRSKFKKSSNNTLNISSIPSKQFFLHSGIPTDFSNPNSFRTFRQLEPNAVSRPHPRFLKLCDFSNHFSSS